MKIQFYPIDLILMGLQCSQNYLLLWLHYATTPLTHNLPIDIHPKRNSVHILKLFAQGVIQLQISVIYEGCSKWITYFYLEASNFKLAQKYSFHALEVLPVARNANFQPVYPLLEGVTVRWFGHSNKVLMNGRSKCLSGLVFPPSKECFQYRKQKEITWGKGWGIRGGEAKQLLFLSSKTP